MYCRKNPVNLAKVKPPINSKVMGFGTEIGCVNKKRDAYCPYRYFMGIEGRLYGLRVAFGGTPRFT